MAYIEPCNIEFIDLTDVEEQEKNWILSSLHTWDPNVVLPWKKYEVTLKTCYTSESDFNTNNVNKKISVPTHMTAHNYQQEYVENPGIFIETLKYCPAKQINASNRNKNEIEKIIVDNGNSYEDVKVEKINFDDNNKSKKSWASLFNNKQENSTLNGEKIQITDNALSNNTNGNVDLETTFYPDCNPKYDSPNFYRMGEFLSDFEIDNRITSLQPKGLINRSNYCYINSILQALLACPPMFNMISGLAKNVLFDKKGRTPFIDSMARFVNEFQPLAASQRISRRPDKNQKKDCTISINCGTPFEPNWIYKILNGMRSDTFVVEGLQEDAEEFLGCLLNGLNDEMVELIKLVNKTMSKTTIHEGIDTNNVDKDWQVMGPKNKGCVTRRTEILKTPISSIFGGHLRSRVHRTGDQSTDNIQPFFTLQLNIEKVTTVRDALEALVSKNQLEGVTSSKTNEEVEAWQQVTIEELPIVLILHLKCFDYKLDGCTKIVKGLEFPIDLKIDSKLLSSKTNYSGKEKQYKLFAVVYHDGKEASKGHYITDAYHVGYASWLRYDDAAVKTVQEDQVLNPNGTRVPYLLFYRRSDSVKVK